MSQTKLLILMMMVASGVVAAHLVPPPEGIPPGDFHVVLLFVLTIAVVVWNPFPIGQVVLISLAIGLITGTLSTTQALRGYSNGVTWIIVAAFLFARAFVKTGLGRRIALVFIRVLGRSSLRLGYALGLSDLVLAPVTASNTARTGGIIFPIARSLAREFDSRPGPTAGRIGLYLLFTAYQTNVVTSAMFLTAMAANGISIQLALETAGVEITWGLWFVAASLPGAISMLLVPYLIYRLQPPELTETPEAQEYARKELLALGALSREEKILSGVFAALAIAWGTAGWHGLSTLSTALTAIAVLLLTGVLEWRDIGGEHPAWGTFIWFGGFVSLAGTLNETAVLDWFTSLARTWFGGWNGIAALLVLVVIYTYLHYGFAGMTTQIIALYAAFLAIALAAGAPPLLSSLVLCFFSNLYAATTHYGDGAAPIYYGSGYIDQPTWWRIGFVISVAHLVVWLGPGMLWWRLLGIW